MPCNIGYKTYTPVKIPAPVPKELRKKSKAPAIDSDLLAKIGAEDSEFVEWLKELDSKPLLDVALERALKAFSESLEGISLSVDENGNLCFLTKYLDAEEKNSKEAIINKFAELWQMEMMKIIGELLDYEVVLEQQKSSWVLEGEQTSTDAVHRYFRITKEIGDESAAFMFEHFASSKALELEAAKFVVLAQKFGVRLRLPKTRIVGQPIPEGIEHRHFLKSAGGN